MCKKNCFACGNEFEEKELIPYKYEPEIKLCEDCNAQWMDDSNDGEVD